MTSVARASSAPRLSRAGIVRIVSVVVMLGVTAAVFFLAAGTVEVVAGWIYYGGSLAYLALAVPAILVLFPGVAETVNARGRLNKDVKAWDKVFGLAYTMLLLVSPAVAGFDVGRLHSLELPRLVHWLGLGVTVLANALVHWAMVVNTHAETGVRIQEDRHHAVVSSGPYRVVRHPFYIAMIVTQLVYPLAIGSLWAFAPAVVMAVLFVWRTAREDETLRRELDGYEAYASRTRYRLLPGVW